MRCKGNYITGTKTAGWSMVMAGASVNVTEEHYSQSFGKMDVSVLMKAAYYNTPEVVELLLNLGADVNYSNYEDYTALKYAESNPKYSEEITAIILKAMK